EVRELLRSHRLVSIVGVGGSGKTRVSVQAAAGMIHEFKNGVWFVDLSPIHRPELVATAIGAALSVPIASDANGPDELVNLLRRKSLLLVLDNCEHLLDSVTPLVERLMTECAGVYVLATSREPLAAPTERVYRLPVLSVPPPGPMRASDSERYGAIALFVERATAAKPSFRLTDENADVVARICRQVDGIALGIELTAARVAVASVEQLAEHLAESLHVITIGQRGGLARHQTMLALIDWSYDLLSDDERRLFGRLAAFSGGWTLDMASHICIDDTIDPFELFDLHSSLLDRSLVTEDRSTSEKRFRFLEPIRAYAREKLFASGEADKLASAHSAFFRTLADDADRAFYSMPSREWFSSVQAHLDNYRAALAWSLAEGNDVELGAAIVGSLSWYFYYSSPTEGIRWINTALAAQSLSMEREARLWMALSPLYGIPTEEKRSAGERAVTLYRTLNVPSRLVHALRMLGLTLAWYYPEELELARELMAEAYELVQSLGDPVAKALVLQAQSQVLEADDFAGRRKLKEAAYELLIEHGNDRQIAVVLTDLSEGAFGERDEAAAFSYGREAVQYAQASGSRNTMLCAGINLAHYAAALGDWETAYDAADRALALADAAQATEMITYTLNAFACLSAGIGDVERSALLFGFCNARFGVVHTPRHDGMCEEILYRRASVKLRNILGETETQRLLTTGAGLSEGEAIDLALRRGQS
ncbi:MAG TPA: hypothetical protein VMV73_00690, partial [Candidatus Dormibacteraeota bacterium]|nr:hypothetical protein [Candidatus Dormibacteraeota bacterium]